MFFITIYSSIRSSCSWLTTRKMVVEEIPMPPCTGGQDKPKLSSQSTSGMSDQSGERQIRPKWKHFSVCFGKPQQHYGSLFIARILLVQWKRQCLWQVLIPLDFQKIMLDHIPFALDVWLPRILMARMQWRSNWLVAGQDIHSWCIYTANWMLSQRVCPKLCQRSHLIWTWQNEVGFFGFEVDCCFDWTHHLFLSFCSSSKRYNLSHWLTHPLTHLGILSEQNYSCSCAAASLNKSVFSCFPKTSLKWTHQFALHVSMRASMWS